ncbi:uncharacterized protein LOC106085154 isoform X1 [Stomoxys calcitrans]|uniref:uncharacterized protein LOC106085154 isoform X1 n=1 Tax=Stomoxys calcitrans TaxID=35570 RepID=UPI0027E30827|nr:uncharacterized protein LOC106085154 isoform X1 [Stomoxys calcitrans]
MRVGKKLNISETKKTRACVVRLEKLSHNSLSPTPSPPIRRTQSTSAQKTQQHYQDHQKGGGNSNARQSHSSAAGGVMGVTPKHLAASSQSRGPIKKRPVGDNNSNSPRIAQQRPQASTMSAMRSNQKAKVVSRASKASTPAREETPTPTIASGRSRRAIKPNPKYASEDMVTPRMVRNVGGAASSAKSSMGADGKRRKNSTSSDDFYNRNSEDELIDDDSQNYDTKGDKAYKLDEKDEALDSDISEIEEEISKRAHKGRPKSRNVPATPSATTGKTSSQTPNANVKRLFSTPASMVRTAPTHLQQLRRSLQSANAQRNQNFLAGSGSSMAQKRKLDDANDSDSDGSYTVARKQMLVTTSTGVKVRMPIKENSSMVTNQANRLQRPLPVQKTNTSSEGKPPVNGGNKNMPQPQFLAKRRIIDSSKISQHDNTPSKLAAKTVPSRQIQQTPGGNNKTPMSNKSFAQSTHAPVGAQKTLMGSSNATSVPNRMRTSSPKPVVRKESSNSTSKLLTSSTATSSPPSAPTQQQKQQQSKLQTLPIKPIDKLKSALASTIIPASGSSTQNSKIATNSKTISSNSQANSQTTTKASPIATTAEVISLNDESPNSTMDDFETMPTFTIVNVNDIINKKGDVLITKSKAGSASLSKPGVIEFSDSITLDDDENDDGDDEDEDRHDAKKAKGKSNKRDVLPTKVNKLPTMKNSQVVDGEKKKLPTARNTSSENVRKQQQSTTTVLTNNLLTMSSSSANKPKILNHKLGLRNNPRVAAKTSTPVSSIPDKPAPRILNSVVGKKTQPVKPMITNLDDSAEESFPLSLDEEETEDEAESKSFEQSKSERNAKLSLPLDTAEDTDSEVSAPEDKKKFKVLLPKNSSKAKTDTSPASTSPIQRKKRLPNTRSSPIMVTNNKKRLFTPAAAKENSLAATNQQVGDAKSPTDLTPTIRKPPAEKVVISKQGDKIIKKITCFETWYVINMPLEPKRQTPLVKNQLDMPLINLANSAKAIHLPSDLWSCKVTLYELSASTLAKSTFVTYTGNLEEYNISEEDRGKYQPSCVMFRRSIQNRQQSRMPYDRAVIFKNKTFSTNIDGKNIRLVGAPSIINSEKDIEILLDVVDGLTLQSDFVEYATIIQ